MKTAEQVCAVCLLKWCMLVVNQKVKYVKAQPQTREHTCHWPECKIQVPPAMWGCKPHWMKLPLHLRRRIWTTYRPGQEMAMDPPQEYLDAANAAQAWIEEYLSATKF